MPKIKLPFATADAIPAELKAFASADNTVEMWVGDRVAEETNPQLEAARNTILGEKKTLQERYDGLTSSTAELAREVQELRTKVATGTSVTPEELALVGAVKAVLPAIKPEDLKRELSEIPNLRSFKSGVEQRDANKQLFSSSGFKNEAVFLDLLSSKEKNPNLEGTAIVKETVDGKEIAKAVAKVKKDGGTIEQVSLADYVAQNPALQPYVPLLNVDPGTQTQLQPPPAQPWIMQPPTLPGQAPGTTPGDDLGNYIAKMNASANAKTNALLPPTQPATGPAEGSQPGLHVNQN
jgi:hypothetical protein